MDGSSTIPSPRVLASCEVDGVDFGEIRRLEERLISRVDLPLKLDGNSHDCFHAKLTAARAEAPSPSECAPADQTANVPASGNTGELHATLAYLLAAAALPPTIVQVTKEDVLQLLDAADFDALIGGVETADVDFKRSPYRLDEASQAFELAKDVTALANIETGGILVVGFQTCSPEESGLDTVETVHPFARALFNRDQWLAKVHQLAYPTVVGLDAVFKPSADDPDRGVAVIVVPAQAPESRYFVVAKPFVSDDGAPGWLIGLSVRSGDRNRPLSIGEIHALVSRSLHLGTDVAEVKALVRDLHEANAAGVMPQNVPADALAGRIDRAINEMQEQ